MSAPGYIRQAHGKRQYFQQERVIDRRPTADYGVPEGNDGTYVVRAFSILTTDHVAFEVYEREAGHSTTFRSDEYGRLGAVRSRKLPAELAELPFGAERSIAVGRWHAGNDRLCGEVIRAAFPEVPFRAVKHGQAWANLDEVNAAVQS